jgi:nitrogen fixation protein NifX
MKEILAAVASSDGINVNTHFGAASFFRLFRVADKKIIPAGMLDATAARQHKMNHDISDFERMVNLLSGCDCVIAEKIGPGAAQYLLKREIRVFEASGEIKEVLSRIYDIQL